jgi:hypothetical protein
MFIRAFPFSPYLAEGVLPLEPLFPVPVPEEGVLLGVEGVVLEPLVLLFPDPVLPELFPLEGVLAGELTLFVEEFTLLVEVEEVEPVAPVLSELVLDVLELLVAAPLVPVVSVLVAPWFLQPTKAAEASNTNKYFFIAYTSFTMSVCSITAGSTFLALFPLTKGTFPAERGGKDPSRL